MNAGSFDINTARWPKLLRATLAELGLSTEQIHWIADRFGYAGSASAFMALYDALEQEKIDQGHLVAFCTSGAGFVLSAALFRWV